MKTNKDLNKYKSWNGYKNAPDILPSAGDGISMSTSFSDLAFYVQGVSWVNRKPPMKITPHHDFEPVDCQKFAVIEFQSAFIGIAIHTRFLTQIVLLSYTVKKMMKGMKFQLSLLTGLKFKYGSQHSIWLKKNNDYNNRIHAQQRH